MGVVTGDEGSNRAAGLSDDERRLLAREVAADGYAKRRDYQFRCPECADLFFDSVAVETVRNAFTDGWEAALTWVKEQRKGKEWLDKVCTGSVFEDGGCNTCDYQGFDALHWRRPL